LVDKHVLSFRRQRTEFGDQSFAEGGAAHGNPSTAIRDRIDQFHATSVPGDADAAIWLRKLNAHIHGLTGQGLAQQPDVAAKLSQACQALEIHILDPASIRQLAGLKRRVVLD
jgi:hypothetical protein